MRFNVRRNLIMAHDLVATALALLASCYIRFGDLKWDADEDWLSLLVPGLLLVAVVAYSYLGVDRPKWRFASLPDLSNIVLATTVLALALLVFDYILVSPQLLGRFYLGKITIALYWVLQIFFLMAPRVAYRYFRYSRTRHHARSCGFVPILVLGRAADAEVLLRAIESGAVKKVRVAGILSPSPADQGQSVRGISVLGYLDDFERIVDDMAARDVRIARLVLTASALEPEAKPEAVLMRARQRGLPVSRLPSLEGNEPVRLAPVQVEDLLLRPTAKIDYGRLERFISGKTVVVTGGGGSIGAEICDRVVTFGAGRLVVLENSEPALHAVLESLATKTRGTVIEGRIADVRDRTRIFNLMAKFKPDLIFHAAALKHVPLLEKNWGEGIKTNIFGSVNVADAAVAVGAAMVMISTDKAIEPVSVLGATKRFAEIYCQALDAEQAALRARTQASVATSAGEPQPASSRLIAVRFGNVLASNGSVVPKFKAQIEAGGPVTITHPEMVRYFMTIREACDLVVTAATHALGTTASDVSGSEGRVPDASLSDVSVYVLNMGQPVKILELAERMIRLAGMQPGTDIDIKFTGIRPGERLNEILFAREEPVVEIGVAGVVAAKPVFPPIEAVRRWLGQLDDALSKSDVDAIYRVLQMAVPDFSKGRTQANRLQEDAADAGVKSESLKPENLKSESLKSESLKSESLKSESLKSESLKSESLKSESLKSESLKSESLKSESLKSDLRKSIGRPGTTRVDTGNGGSPVPLQAREPEPAAIALRTDLGSDLAPIEANEHVAYRRRAH